MLRFAEFIQEERRAGVNEHWLASHGISTSTDSSFAFAGSSLMVSP